MSAEKEIFTERPSRVSELFGEKESSVEITSQEREKYGLLAVGKFNEQNTEVVESERESLTPAEQEAELFVNNYVKDFIESKNKVLAAQGKRLIGDWPKLHVSDVREAGNQFEVKIQQGVANYGKLIALGREDGIRAAYKSYSGVAEKELITFNRFKELFQPTPLAVDGLIFTSDNYVLIAKRHPEKVGTYGEAWHVPSGYVDDSDRNDAGKIDAFKAIRREIEEETGITADQIKDLICVGAAKNPDISTVNILFIGRTDLKSADIVDRGAINVKKRLLLHPKDIEGDIRPRRIIGKQNEPTKILPALLKIDQVFGKAKKHGAPGPELAVPSSQALFFLVDKMLKK